MTYLIEAGHHIPQLHLVSFVILWYSFVEQQLLDFCKSRKLSITVTIGDRVDVGKGISKARKFLLDGANYEIDAIHWNELKQVQKLRNKLVHEGQRIDRAYTKPDSLHTVYTDEDGMKKFFYIEKNLFQYLKKHNIIEDSVSYLSIKPSFEYGKYLIQLAYKLFAKLQKDIPPNKFK